MNANDRQVAGTHYRSEYQHWDLVPDLGLGYFEGQITKYTTRSRGKNGKQDLEKALHFLDKLIELVHADRVEPRPRSISGENNLLERYCVTNRLTILEQAVVTKVATWVQPRDLRDAKNLLLRLIAALYDDDGSEPGAEYTNQDR